MQVPRNYQLRLLQLAKDNNVIAVLNTGAGKTLIAVMLIRLSLFNSGVKFKEGLIKKKTICVFLVPAVPLVNQQAEYLRQNCAFKVAEVYGAMGVDQWKRLKWDQIITDNEVIVMTPQILINSINAGYYGLDSFSLIIFDEAHHARKNHPYNHVMEIYRHHKDPETLPKLFGMTASPTCSKAEAIESIRTLELNLQCKAFTVDPEDSVELQNFVPRPQEHVVYYSLGSFNSVPSLYQIFLECNGNHHKQVSKLMEECLAESDENGVWWGARFLESAYTQIGKMITSTEMPNPNKRPKGPLEDGEIDLSEEKSGSKDEKLVEIYNKITRKLDSEEFAPINPGNLKRGRKSVVNSSFQIPAVTSDQISPKIQKLIELLEGYKDNPDFCGIIFVEKRNYAKLLADCLSNVPSLKSFIKPAVLVGHGAKSKSLGSQMFSKDQEKVVKLFRSGTYNLLIGEEGIDIQACILVVRLTLFQTLIDYIQSRGRARHSDSRYVVFIEEGNVEKEKLYQRTVEKELEMHKALVELSTAPAEEEENLATANLLKADEILVNPKSGARLTLFSALNVLSRYCSMMPKDEFCSSLPTYVLHESLGFYECTVYLPMSVPSDCRAAKGLPTLAKKKAKQYAAFKSVQQLAECGELDDYFLPAHLQLDINGTIQPLVQQIGATKLRNFHSGIAACLQGDWNATSIVHLSTIKIKLMGPTSRPNYSVKKLNVVLNQRNFDVAVITSHRIQEDDDSAFDFELPIREIEGHLGVEMTDAGTVSVTPEDLTKIRIFHTEMLGAFFRKDMMPESDWAYLVAPIKRLSDGRIVLDNDLLAQVFSCMDNRTMDTRAFRNLLTAYKAKYDLAIARALADSKAAAIEANAKLLPEECELPKEADSKDEVIEEVVTADALIDEAVKDPSNELLFLDESFEESERLADTLDDKPSKNSKDSIQRLRRLKLKVEAEKKRELFQAESVLDFEKPPHPDDQHPVTGTFLEDIKNKKYTLKFMRENIVLIDNYYFGRKYLIVDLITEISPHDRVPSSLISDNANAKKYFAKMTPAEFYHGRLRCWETVLADQPIIKAVQIPGFTQPARLKARYSESIAKKEDIDFPPMRAASAPVYVYLLPQFCFVYSIPRKVIVNDAVHLPMIFKQFSHALYARDFIKRYDFDFVPRLQLQIALTTPAAHLPYDYERLENLGDSFLKVLISLHLFASHPTYHEGRLTSLRNILEGNRLFTKKAVQTGILGAITSSPLTKMLWSPLIRHYEIQDKEADKLFFGDEEEDNALPEGSNNLIVEVDAAQVESDTLRAKLIASQEESNALPVASDAPAIESDAPPIESDDLPVESNALPVESDAALVESDAVIPTDGGTIKPVKENESTMVAAIQQTSLQTELISDKTIADCMEAIIGACVLADSIRGGAKAANLLLNEEYELDWIAGYGQMFRKSGSYNHPEDKYSGDRQVLNTIQEIIGYKFKNPNLILEALTHPSAVDINGSSACYQRLEFLGDAVLHYVISLYLFQRYPLLSPGSLSEYRSALVCNQFLSVVCGALDIHKLVNHNSESYTGPILEFSKALDSHLKIYRKRMGSPSDTLLAEPEISYHGQSLGDFPARTSDAFWDDMEEAPKAVADVYEAILGAVFVDCMDQPIGTEMSLDPVRLVIERTLLKPWLPLMGPPSAIKVHPVKELVDFVSTEIKCRDLKISALWNEKDGSYSCRVLIHGISIGEGDGVSKRSARKAAAQAAVGYVKLNLDQLKAVCICKSTLPSNIPADIEEEEGEY